MFKCPSCKMFASLSSGKCWKCGAQLVDTDRRKNAHVRRVIPYNPDSDLARNASAFLQRVDAIRMRQDDGPGSGHFAAGSAAVDGLIRLGFSGTIEVFHQNDAEAQRRMGTCYPGFAAGGVDLVGLLGRPVRVNYTPLPDYRELDALNEAVVTRLFFEERPRALLGILGASDGFGNADEGLEVDTVSPAAALNTAFGMILQPFAWPRVRAIAHADNGYFQQILHPAPFAGYVIDVPGLLGELPPYQRSGPRATRLISDYVNANAEGVDAAVVRTVTATLAKTCSGGCHLMPLYGLHAGGQQLGDCAVNAIVRAIRALRGEGFLDGPVLIFNIAGRYEPDQESRGMCTVLRADNGQAAVRITDALDGIFVIQSPGLKKALFNQLAANATLPMLLEGANTANLCGQLGTPFLALADNDSIPTVDEAGARGHIALRALAPFLGGAQRLPDLRVAELVAAIRDAVTPGTELHGYFRRVQDLVRAPENDQLAVALAALRQYTADFAVDLPPVHPVHLAPVRLRGAPSRGGTIYKCPACKKFASAGPGKCLKCGAELREE